MWILNIFTNISSNNTFHHIIITHSSWKTSKIFIFLIIRIKSFSIIFSRNIAKKNIKLFFYIKISFTSNTSFYNIITTLSIPINFLFFSITNMLIRKIKFTKIIHIFICLILKPLSIKNICFIIIFCNFLTTSKFSFTFNINRLPIYT